MDSTCMEKRKNKENFGLNIYESSVFQSVKGLKILSLGFALPINKGRFFIQAKYRVECTGRLKYTVE